MARNETEKGLIISGIIHVLNDQTTKENRKLCKQNLHSEQKPLHGADMVLTLAFLEDRELNKIAAACGI